MMECGIIRDLFPSYIDGLISEESRQAIEAHLEECAECRGYLEAMRKELASEKYVELNKSQAKAEIKVFEKLRRRMFYAVIVTAIVVAMVCTAYESYFCEGYSTLPGDVDITYENNDGIVRVGLMPKKNDIYIIPFSEVSSECPEKGLNERFTPVNYHISPSTVPQDIRGCYLRYIFRDDGTVIYETQSEFIELSGDETLTIEFGIKEFVITVNDLRTEAGAEKLRQWMKTEEEK